MPARRYLVRGAVQGVGYRFFAQSAATARGVRGWVRNLPDGRVEVCAEGNDAALGAFKMDLGRGPGGSRVDGIEEHDAGACGSGSSFSIRG